MLLYPFLIYIWDLNHQVHTLNAINHPYQKGG